YTKRFNCWIHLVVMLYAVIMRFDSFMLKPSSLSKGEIVAMDRAYIDYEKELPLEETKEILTNGKECVIAVCDEDNLPYAVPINYVYDGTHIYLHPTKSGHKTDALKYNPNISLCVIAESKVIPQEN
ncbi:MAG: pyridoxamine 5'-phosphate oxidase family protein, partial [Muribaculaceae bacterium]|nr:pyridoxamine 5'-phosphate oxidase family protein [Muribaculaceae bacterium]